MTDIEKKRHQIRRELENQMRNAILIWRPDSFWKVEQILDDWVKYEDGDNALDRLITLIIY